jgi:hypothetical protein
MNPLCKKERKTNSNRKKRDKELFESSVQTCAHTHFNTYTHKKKAVPVHVFAWSWTCDDSNFAAGGVVGVPVQEGMHVQTHVKDMNRAGKVKNTQSAGDTHTTTKHVGCQWKVQIDE